MIWDFTYNHDGKKLPEHKVPLICSYRLLGVMDGKTGKNVTGTGGEQ